MDKDDMVNQFMDVTGVTPDQAKVHLEAENWTLQLALTKFFENDDGESENKMSPSESAGRSSDWTRDAPSTSENSNKPGNAVKPKVKSNTGSRIATIHNMTKSDDEDEDEQGQAFYTGTARSGQQILGPPKKNPIKDYVSEVFRSAQESGAEVIDQPQSSSAPSPFVGTGYRLGQTDVDHTVLPNPSRSHRTNNTEPVILRLWRQGFSINDGELRLYEDPANKDFLDKIAKGEIPQELRPIGGSMVHVDLEDHRHEEFVRVKPKVKPFSGQGQALGSPTPNVVGDFPTVQNTVEQNTQNETQATQQLNINMDQPTTMIQIRLADSSRIAARFNHSHTIGDIRNYIITARPQYAQQNFMLLTTFPSKELADEAQTIDKAGLLNAAIMQRLK